MTEIMKIFEFCHAVMLDEESKFNLPPFPRDFNELSITADTDFNIPRKRCAFMYKYGTCNMQFIVGCIVKFFTECQDAVSIVAHDMKNINLCSLSVGPGIDYFAFLIAVEHSKLFANMPQFKCMKVITKYAAWRNTLKIMQKHGGTLCHNPLFLTDEENVQVLQGNIFQDINDKFQCVKEANIVMMVKTLNLTAPLVDDKLLSSNLKEVLNMMKPGSLLLCMDTKPSIGLLHRTLTKLRGSLLYAPDHMSISLSPLTFPAEFEKLYGCFPVMQTRGCFIVWQKEIDFSLLEWPGNVIEERQMSVSGTSCTSNRRELITNDRRSKSVISNESGDIANGCRLTSCTSNGKNNIASDDSDTLNETASSRFCIPSERERFANDWLANNWVTNNWLENDCRSRYASNERNSVASDERESIANVFRSRVRTPNERKLLANDGHADDLFENDCRSGCFTSNERKPFASIRSKSFTPNEKGSIAIDDVYCEYLLSNGNGDSDIPNESSADQAYDISIESSPKISLLPQYQIMTTDDILAIQNNSQTDTNIEEKKHTSCGSNKEENVKCVKVRNNSNELNADNDKEIKSNHKGQNSAKEYLRSDKAIQTDPFQTSEKRDKNQSSVISSLTKRITQMTSLLENFEGKKLNKSEMDANRFNEYTDLKLNESKDCLQSHSAEAIANSGNLSSQSQVACCSCSRHLVKQKPIISGCCSVDLERSVNEDCCKSGFYKHCCCHSCIRYKTQQSNCMCSKHSFVDSGSRNSSVSNNVVASVPSIVIPLQNLKADDLSRILQMALASS